MPDQWLTQALNDLADMYTPEVVMTEATRLLAPVTPSTPNRGPATARAAGERRARADLSRFGRGSRPAKLLAAFGNAKGMTAYEAAASVMEAHPGIEFQQHFSVTRFEGCRRRVSDLAKVGYIEDSEERRSNPGTDDPSIVWRITPLGREALAALRSTGWTRPAKAAAA